MFWKSAKITCFDELFAFFMAAIIVGISFASPVKENLEY